MSRQHRFSVVLTAAALAAGALQMRPAITSVAALVHEIAPDSASWMPWLLAVSPPLLFGLTAPVGPWLARRLGTRRTLAALLAVLGLSLMLRPWSDALLVAGTATSCLAIMAVGVLLPQWAKATARPGRSMALITCGIAAGAAVGAAASPPLADLLPWRAALACWAIPAFLAALMTIAAPERSQAFGHANRPVGHTRALCVTVAAFGLQAAIYFPLTTSLPEMLMDRGLTPASAALVLTVVNLSGIAASLITPVIASSERVRPWLASCAACTVAAALGLLLFGGPQYAYIAAVPLGLAQAALFSLALTLPVYLGSTPQHTGWLSAASQAVGYVLGGAVAAVVGAVGNAEAFVILAGCAAGFGLVGCFTGRRQRGIGSRREKRDRERGRRVNGA